MRYGRSRAAPHRADGEVVGLDVGAREPTEETHEPRVEGVAGAGSRRPVAGRPGRAERRVDTRAAAGGTLPLALIEDRLQLRDGRQPPVAVVVEPSRLCAPVPARTVADAGRPAVQRREEAREGGPIRRGPTAAPDVRVVQDRKSTRLNSSHRTISYAVFCLKKKNGKFRNHPAGESRVR